MARSGKGSRGILHLVGTNEPEEGHEVCVLCRTPVNIGMGTPVSQRPYYVEGAGQNTKRLCGEAHLRRLLMGRNDAHDEVSVSHLQMCEVMNNDATSEQFIWTIPMATELAVTLSRYARILN